MNSLEHSFCCFIFSYSQEYRNKLEGKYDIFTSLHISRGMNSFFLARMYRWYIDCYYISMAFQYIYIFLLLFFFFFASIYSQQIYKEPWNFFSLVNFGRLWGLCSSGLKPNDRNRYHLQWAAPPLWQDLEPSGQSYLICLWMNSWSATAFFTWVY